MGELEKKTENFTWDKHFIIINYIFAMQALQILPWLSFSFSVSSFGAPCWTFVQPPVLAQAFPNIINE